MKFCQKQVLQKSPGIMIVVLLLWASTFSFVKAAQVDLGLTLGSLQGNSGNILSGVAVRLGTFSAYSDTAGLAYFTGKDYNTLFSSFTSFTEISSPQVLNTDPDGQIYQSFDTGSTAVGVRMFAWLYDSSTVSSAANWVIVSGGANPTGVNDSVYNPMWLAVAPASGEINVIEAGSIYSQIFASKISGNNILATTLFDPEGANIVLIPEPSSGALLSLGLSLIILRSRRGPAKR